MGCDGVGCVMGCDVYMDCVVRVSWHVGFLYEVWSVKDVDAMWDMCKVGIYECICDGMWGIASTPGYLHKSYPPI